MKPSETPLELRDCSKYQTGPEDLFTIPNSKYIYANSLLDYNKKYKEEFREFYFDLLAEQQEQG